MSTALSRRHWAMLLAAVVVLAALGWGVRWWTHPDLFGGGYGSFDADPLPTKSAALHLGMPGLADPARHETITLTGYRVHFSRNSAGATGSLAVCVPRSRSDDTHLGTGHTVPKDLCRVVRPVVKGTRMLLDGERGDYLVLGVTAHRAGTATAVAVDLSYRRGASHLFQQGTQHIGDGEMLTVNAE